MQPHSSPARSAPGGRGAWGLLLTQIQPCRRLPVGAAVRSSGGWRFGTARYGSLARLRAGGVGCGRAEPWSCSVAGRSGATAWPLRGQRRRALRRAVALRRATPAADWSAADHASSGSSAAFVSNGPVHLLPRTRRRVARALAGDLARWNPGARTPCPAGCGGPGGSRARRSGRPDDPGGAPTASRPRGTDWVPVAQVGGGLAGEACIPWPRSAGGLDAMSISHRVNLAARWSGSRGCPQANQFELDSGRNRAQVDAMSHSNRPSDCPR
jgi:hypothetical protein